MTTGMWDFFRSLARSSAEAYRTFADSCRERWGFDTAHASRLIGSVEVMVVLPIGNSPLPTTETQTRELARIPAEQRADVWIGTAHVGVSAAPTPHPVPPGARHDDGGRAERAVVDW